MNLNQTRSAGDGALLRRYEYEDGWVVAVDLGADAESVSVDTVGETAIVVIESGDEPAEMEFELPGPAASTAVESGVVTVEGDAVGGDAVESDTAEDER